MGYKVRLGPGSKDGGVDVFAERDLDFGPELTLVQCKRNSPEHKVGEPIIKQLHADVNDRKASKGLVVTTSFFTGPALKYIESSKFRLAGADFLYLQKWGLAKRLGLEQTEEERSPLRSPSWSDLEVKSFAEFAQPYPVAWSTLIFPKRPTTHYRIF